MTGKTEKRRRARTIEELASAPWLTLAEAARMLNLSAISLRRAIWHGELRGYLVGCCLRINRSDLEKWLASQQWSPQLAAQRTARPHLRGRKPNTPAVAPADPVAEVRPVHEASK
jgi:excisionase family DNA binding protein